MNFFRLETDGTEVMASSGTMGKSSERYIKGWDERDEERMKDVTQEVITQTPRSGKSAIDYLNEEDF